MKLKVNGRDEDYSEGMRTISDLLSRVGLEPELVAVELNGVVMDKKEYAMTSLSEGDVIEVIKFVGGGSDF